LGLINHLIGDREQLFWNCEAKRPSRIKVEDELEFVGLYDRQIAYLLAPENPAGKTRSPLPGSSAYRRYAFHFL
jgi:hypothetical protein